MKLKIKQNGEWEYIDVDIWSFMKCYFIMILTIYGIILFLLLILLIVGMI